MTYAIIDILDKNKIDFSEIFQTSEETLRESIDGTEFVIKYDLTPSFVSNGSVIPNQELTHAEVLELMSTEVWTNETLIEL